MATDVAGMPNGTYAPHQTYGGVDQNTYTYSANAAASQPPAQQPPPTSSTPSNAQTQQYPQSEVSKDEVGWYFVEQYYTTLSRSPEKLYLFYNKRSQFVSGQETDKVQVCIGQRAINDKIRELDFQDCKVRVTNVDSQSSDTNIVIQVIGEISNKSQPHRKFTQTFVLATQTNGYFVLNDIFRYLVDEEDEPEVEAAPALAEDIEQVPGSESGYQEPPPTGGDAESKTLTSSADPVAVEHDAKEVDKEIEEKLAAPPVTQEEPDPTTNGDAAEDEDKVEDAPATPAQLEPAPVTEFEQPAAAEPGLEAEKAKEPEPTPAASQPKQAATQSTSAPKPAAPPVPMTWAGRAAAANKVATPATPPVATPSVKPSAATVAAPKPVAPVAAPTAAQSTSTATATPTGPAAQRQDTPDSQDDWATVGHNRQQSRQANNQQPEQPQWRGYIKNVLDSVDLADLRKALEDNFGELHYLDIARQKNCAFVDFMTAEGYNKAVSTPFKLANETLQVEERRFKPGSTPYIPRGNFQGGRGRGSSGSQGAARGGFQNNRGNGAPRGGRGTFPQQQQQQQRGGRGGAQA